jgi:Amt family ammonium transporter
VTRLLRPFTQKKSRKGKIAMAIALVSVVLAFATPAFAQEEADPVTTLGTQVNLLWVVIGAVLVVFMQAGFALVETGFTRAKHAAHVVSTNFAIFGLGFIGFFLVGFPLAFGGYSSALIGLEPYGKNLLGDDNWTFLWQGGWALTDLKGTSGAALAGFFLYMVAFMDTVATIPTGAMAERWQWKNFVLWGFFCGAIYYPLFAAWTWGGGWIAKLGNSAELGFGYVDFAGSGVVHAVGGAAALAGAIVIGPRIGKFGTDGSPRAIPGHHIPMAMLGTFILLFGWFGFNAASTLAVQDVQFAIVATNTAIAGAFGAVSCMLFVMWRTGKPDPGMMANGMLAGLVAITAPCAFVDPWAAMLIGIIAGVLVVIAFNFIEHKLKLDDPVGAIAVHGVNGSFGVLCVGLFANGTYGAGWNGTTEGDAATASGVTGIFGDWDNVGLGFGQLVAQLIGLVVIWTVIFGIAFLWFKLSDKISPIRSKEEDELVGLDLPEMGVLAYPEFGGHGGVPSTTSS